LPPVISSFTGPTQLKVGEKGAWKIQARDPENGNLTYNINWGESNYMTDKGAAELAQTNQTAMFTHAYSTSGNYTIQVKIFDNKGLSAEALLTVSIVGETGWKTYRDDKYNYKFDYPADNKWLFSEYYGCCTGVESVPFIDLPSRINIEVEKENSNISLVDWIKRRYDTTLYNPKFTEAYKLALAKLSDYSFYTDYSSEVISGKKVQVILPDEFSQSSVIYAKRLNNIFVISYTESNERDKNFVTNKKVIDQMLSTFRFTQDTTPPSDCLPDGTLIKMPNDFKVYVIQDCKKKWIQSIDEFKQSGYKWNNVTETPADTVNAYNDYVQAVNNLLKIANQEKVYRIVGNRKLWIPSPQAFNTQGLKWQDIQTKDASTVNQYPDAKLLRATGGTTIYYITNGGLKRAIPNMDVFNSYGNKLSDVVDVDQSILNSYPDNILIKEDNGIMVYKLENGTKRWIATDKAFKRLGLDWSKIAPVNQTEFNAYPNGPTIE